MASKKSKKYPYKWPDGSYHSIPAATHAQNVQAKQYGINLDDPVSTGLTNRGAFGMAEAAANRVYGPQISAAENIQGSLPSWFQNYTNSVGGAAQAAQQYAQPLIDTAQTGVTNAAQTAPGLDPSSPQYAKEQQAAQGRQAIAGLGASSLGAVATANQGYFNQLQATAARDLPLAQQYYGREVGRLKGERGQGVVDEYGRIRTNEQNAEIGYGTLKVNTAKAADINPVTGKANPKPPEDRITSGAFAGETDSSIARMTPAQRQAKIDAYAKKTGTSGDKINAYGIKESQWATWSTKHRQDVIRDFKGGKAPSDKDEFGNTPKQRQKAQGSWSKAKTLAKLAYDKGMPWQELYELLVLKNPTIDADMARAAAQAQAGGNVGPKTRARLRALGIKLPAPKKPAHPGPSRGDSGPGAGAGQQRPN